MFDFHYLCLFVIETNTGVLRFEFQLGAKKKKKRKGNSVVEVSWNQYTYSWRQSHEVVTLSSVYASTNITISPTPITD